MPRGWRPVRGGDTGAAPRAPRRRTGSSRPCRSRAGEERSAPGTARRSRRRGGPAPASGVRHAGLDEALQPAEIALEDLAEDWSLRARRELREQRRNERLAPPDDRRRAVGPRLERDQARAGEPPLVADREPPGRLELRDLDRIGDRDPEDANGRLRLRASAHRPRRL